MARRWRQPGSNLQPKQAGDTSLTVTGNVSGWQAGDTLVLPDTREVSSTAEGAFQAGTLPGDWEEVTIDHIQGNQIFLTSPLQFDHLGAHEPDGTLELLPQVALLDRNVVISSQNPSGTRGVTYFTARADVDIEYARFENLGRTNAFQPVDNTTFDANGNVTHIGTNEDGDYAVYFDDLMGPVNPTNTGYQFTFVGNTVDGALKWGVTVDNSSYGLLSNNVVYDAEGAGFVTDEGSEIGNAFLNNITIHIEGTQVDGSNAITEGTYGLGGSGFWFARGGNTVSGNVAADSVFAGFTFCGYTVLGQVTLPNFRGADPEQPGQTYVTLLNPSAPFANNEAYGMTTYGLWAAFISGVNTLPDQPAMLISGLTLWNIWNVDAWIYHTSDVTFSGLHIIGDEAAQNRNDVGSTGVELWTYENFNTVIQDSSIVGERYGVLAPKNDASQPGLMQPTVIQNTTFDNYINVVASLALDDRPDNGNELVLRYDLFALETALPIGPAPASSIAPPANIWMDYATEDGDNVNYTQPSVVLVYNYDRVAGDNFQVFYSQQTASYVLPLTAPARLAGTNSADGTIGASGRPDQPAGLERVRNRNGRRTGPRWRGRVDAVYQWACGTDPNIFVATPGRACHAMERRRNAEQSSAQDSVQRQWRFAGRRSGLLFSGPRYAVHHLPRHQHMEHAGGSALVGGLHRGPQWPTSARHLGGKLHVCCAPRRRARPPRYQL